MDPRFWSWRGRGGEWAISDGCGKFGNGSGIVLGVVGGGERGGMRNFGVKEHFGGEGVERGLRGRRIWIRMRDGVCSSGTELEFGSFKGEGFFVGVSVFLNGYELPWVGR